MALGGAWLAIQYEAAAYVSAGLGCSAMADRAWVGVIINGAIKIASKPIGMRRFARLIAAARSSRGEILSAAKISAKAGKYSMKRRDLKVSRPKNTASANAVKVARLNFW